MLNNYFLTVATLPLLFSATVNAQSEIILPRSDIKKNKKIAGPELHIINPDRVGN